MPVHDLPELRDKTKVFEDRADAGRMLAQMLGALQELRGSRALVLAIPPGGLPVAASIAESLGLPLDVAAIAKIPFPWNPEAGFGAVAFDGTVKLNQGLISDMGLIEPAISQGKDRALKKVRERAQSLRGTRPFPDLAGRTVVLVDDGLASGMTMETAVEAVKKASPERVIVAVTTGHEAVASRLAKTVQAVYCPNIRGGWGFSLRDAFRHWREVTDREAEEIARRFASSTAA